jgi:hypothetical protein
LHNVNTVNVCPPHYLKLVHLGNKNVVLKRKTSVILQVVQKVSYLFENKWKMLNKGNSNINLMQVTRYCVQCFGMFSFNLRK